MTTLERNVIATWLRDIEYKWPVLIRDNYDYSQNGVITIRTIQIYTHHPGLMIGIAGKNIKDIEDRLNKIVSNRQYKIKIVETFDIVYLFKRLPNNT